MSNEVLIDLALRMAKLEGPQGEGTIANVLRQLAAAMAAQDNCTAELATKCADLEGKVSAQENTIYALRELAAAKNKSIDKLSKMLVKRSE